AEVERDRHGAEHRDGDAQAEAGSDAVVVDAGIAFDGAGIDEGHKVDIVVGANRNLVFEGVQELELPADHETVDVGADAAEFEAANVNVTAAEEAFVDRGGVAGPGNLAAGHEDMLARAVRALPEREEAAAFEIEDREGVGAEDLLKGEFKLTAFRGPQE